MTTAADDNVKGRQPRTASILAADHLRPAAISAGVVLRPGQRFGFHNLRHSLATFLINKEKDTKTVQGLLRHANVSTTLGLYAQSVNSSMVEAQESMLKAILWNGSNAVNWAADDQTSELERQRILPDDCSCFILSRLFGILAGHHADLPEHSYQVVEEFLLDDLTVFPVGNRTNSISNLLFVAGIMFPLSAALTRRNSRSYYRSSTIISLIRN